MLHIPPTNSLLLAAEQEPYKKAYLLTKTIEEFVWKTFTRMGSRQEKDKAERVTRLGKRTREEIAKWNQMTALRFQRGGGGDIRHPRPPLEGVRKIKAEGATDKLCPRQRLHPRDVGAWEGTDKCVVNSWLILEQGGASFREPTMGYCGRRN